MESPPGADAELDGGPAPGGGEGDLAICPICGSASTWRYRTTWWTSSTSWCPPGSSSSRNAETANPSSSTPRPSESELPPFYPSDYHAYNENHGGVARLLVQARARSRATLLRRLIRRSPGVSSTWARATAGTSTSSVDSSTSNARASRSSRTSRPRVGPGATTYSRGLWSQPT